MHAATTSLAPANSMRGEWRRFAAFLKRPTLPERAPLPQAAGLRAVVWLVLLDLLVMAALLGVAGAVMAAGVSLPETALAGMEIGTGIILAVVVIAPLTEEIAFRGWLSGRPGHIFGLLAGALAAMVAGLAAMAFFGAALATAGLVALAAGTLVALAIIYRLRHRNTIGWFRRLFPALFWLSTLGFSLVHLTNFPADQLATALPLVLPQFVTGTILGYTRVHYGLWASVLLHMLHNGAIIALVLAASSAA